MTKNAKDIEAKDKFDVVIGNPPYQGNTKNNEVTGASAIWHRFVELSFDICKEDGYICLVHPCGWRGCGAFSKIGKNIKSKKILYLEIHNMDDGIKTFGASTRYDWYILQNNNNFCKTVIKDQEGKIYNAKINHLPIIPNMLIKNVISLMARDGDERVEVLHSFSNYFSRKLSNEKSIEYKHPCIKYISKNDKKIDLYWSSYNDVGNFLVPKVMFCIDSASGGGIVIDKEGKYLLSQFVAGIVDSDKNLKNIKKAIESDKFRKIMKACQYTKGLYNHKIISLFRKDFWKDFI